MRAPIIVAIVSLALTPAFALAASVNVHGSPAGRPLRAPNRSGIMMGESARATPRATQSRSGLSGAGGESGARFNELSHGRAYITRSQARREDPTLYRHFTRCDTLRDGRITRTEFKNCDGGKGK